VEWFSDFFSGFGGAGLGEDLPSHGRRGHRTRPTRAALGALSTCITVSVLGLLACGTATARVEPKIRVLLYSGSDPIQVGRAARPDEVKLSPGGGLLVGGREEASGWMPNGSGPWRVGSRTVRGQVAVMTEAGRIQVLNRIGLEDYVASTVGGEMPSSWPSEALRAQAVAARTYVLHQANRRRGAAWDVRATTMSQVYGGVDAETKATRSATRATAGEVLTFEGAPILAVFHSTAGGRTATAGEVWGEDVPYLRVVEVEDEDAAPHTYWRTVFETKALRGILEAAGVSVGQLQGLSIGGRTVSGRVERLVVRGSSGKVEIEGRQLKSLLSGMGLRSTLFEIKESPAGFAFVGSGHGHGVGMSQWGARAMARHGASYKRILKRFYPGTRLESLPSRRIAGRGPRRASEGDEK
jgi:stage II sporulation protein D